LHPRTSFQSRSDAQGVARMADHARTRAADRRRALGEAGWTRRQRSVGARTLDACLVLDETLKSCGLQKALIRAIVRAVVRRRGEAARVPAGPRAGTGGGRRRRSDRAAPRAAHRRAVRAPGRGVPESQRVGVWEQGLGELGSHSPCPRPRLLRPERGGGRDPRRAVSWHTARGDHDEHEEDDNRSDRDRIARLHFVGQP
jgi:hypothetical protein